MSWLTIRPSKPEGDEFKFAEFVLQVSVAVPADIPYETPVFVLTPMQAALFKDEIASLNPDEAKIIIQDKLP